MPDDDGDHRTSGTLECAVASTDAGPGNTDACRIGQESVVFKAMCKVGEAGSGTDGAACEAGADCAAGFDCVTGDKGSTCRHYCCSGTCRAQTSVSGSGTFCDVQTLTDVGQKAPVCMPIKRCALFGTGECGANETCAVLTETGDTGCVAVGEQQVGASCDADHCAAGLTCVGQPGSRKCFKLCRVNGVDCGPALACTTSTMFRAPEFGTCQKP
jgi:hypothetical protein